MFESANPKELTKVVQSVITPEVVSDGKAWELSGKQRDRVRLAMFGPGRPTGGGTVSRAEHKEILKQFKDKIAGPMLGSSPSHKARCGVLMVYEVFVDEVFIRPVWEPDLGGGD